MPKRGRAPPPISRRTWPPSACMASPARCRTAADELNGRDQRLSASCVEQAADSLERVSGALQDRELRRAHGQRRGLRAPAAGRVPRRRRAHGSGPRALHEELGRPAPAAGAAGYPHAAGERGCRAAQRESGHDASRRAASQRPGRRPRQQHRDAVPQGDPARARRDRGEGRAGGHRDRRRSPPAPSSRSRRSWSFCRRSWSRSPRPACRRRWRR